MYLGDFALGATITNRFHTVDASGAAVTLAGSPSARVRKGSGAGTTITTGVTLTVDVVTGQHVVDVDTSSGYAAGFDYAIEIVAGTVGGVSIAGVIVGLFSIANRAVEGIKKNTVLANFEFVMVDSADHVTGKTGLTVTATRSIDGAAFAACANSVTEVASGVYAISLAAADVNGDVITFKFTGSGADATLITVKTTL